MTNLFLSTTLAYNNRREQNRFEIEGLTSIAIELLNSNNEHGQRVMVADTWYADKAIHIDHPSFPELRIGLYLVNQNDLNIHVSIDDLSDFDIQLDFSGYTQGRLDCFYLIGEMDNDDVGKELAIEMFMKAYGYQLA